jgi:hypothetical protein
VGDVVAGGDVRQCKFLEWINSTPEREDTSRPLRKTHSRQFPDAAGEPSLRAPFERVSPSLSVSVSGKRDFATQRQWRRKGPSRSTDRAICTTPGNLCLFGTAWWRRQSQSNQSHKSNSLLTGKDTGKYLIAAHCKLRVLLKNAENTSTFCEIPCKMEQGIFGEKTGKAIFRTGNLSLIRDDMTLVGRFDPS